MIKTLVAIISPKDTRDGNPRPDVEYLECVIYRVSCFSLDTDGRAGIHSRTQS